MRTMELHQVTPDRWSDLDRLFEGRGTLGAAGAYPVNPNSPSYRFGGFVPFFEREGFREVGRLGSRRHVMRLDFGV